MCERTKACTGVWGHEGPCVPDDPAGEPEPRYTLEEVADMLVTEAERIGPRRNPGDEAHRKGVLWAAHWLRLRTPTDSEPAP